MEHDDVTNCQMFCVFPLKQAGKVWHVRTHSCSPEEETNWFQGCCDPNCPPCAAHLDVFGCSVWETLAVWDVLLQACLVFTVFGSTKQNGSFCHLETLPLICTTCHLFFSRLCDQTLSVYFLSHLMGIFQKDVWNQTVRAKVSRCAYDRTGKTESHSPSVSSSPLLLIFPALLSPLHLSPPIIDAFSHSRCVSLLSAV